MAESLPIILKKEYGCHRRDILKTEQCLARQLESSMSSGQIISELNDLENSNSLSKRFVCKFIILRCIVYYIIFFRLKIWLTLFITWLCPAVGLTFIDIFFDSLLAIEYYAQWKNVTYVNRSIER